MFRSGTALRNLELKTPATSSTDLDFAVPDDEMNLTNLHTPNGTEIDGCTLAIINFDDDDRQSRPQGRHPLRSTPTRR